ncbi:MAG TPA: GNAT family N-acetyltransferase [Gemmataceae bacterium]|nr:GNAT family N-acetyltransferase [Gemmataceae bacterium]
MHSAREPLPGPGPVIIRPATAADLPAIVAMRDALNDLERAGCPHAAIQRMTLEEFTAVWGGTLASPTHCWRIVEAGGRPVGFGLIYLVFPQTRSPGAFLHWAYLDPAYRRQGLGRALLDHLLDWARAAGAQRVELQFIDGNEAAERFWTKAGFRPFARKCVRYWEG